MTNEEEIQLLDEFKHRCLKSWNKRCFIDDLIMLIKSRNAKHEFTCEQIKEMCEAAYNEFIIEDIIE